MANRKLRCTTLRNQPFGNWWSLSKEQSGARLTFSFTVPKEISGDELSLEGEEEEEEEEKKKQPIYPRTEKCL